MKIAESTSDGFDYTDITSDQIINNVTTNPQDQVLLHDAGGDKSSTINAVPQIISILQNKGRRFVTLEEVDGLNNLEGVDPETYIAAKTKLPLPIYRFLHSGVLPISTYIRYIIELISQVFNIAIIITFLASLFRLIILIIGNIMFQPYKSQGQKKVNYPISILVPAYNESKVIVNTINSLLLSTYLNYEILIIDDGSSDNSLEVLNNAFGNHPKVRILPKPNGGKASAINYGIQNAQYDYFLCMDADTIFNPDSIELMMRHFSNPKVRGVAGNVVVGNDFGTMMSHNSKLSFWKTFNIWTVFQRIEYVVSNNFAKRGFDPFNCTYIVPGAIGAYHKKTVLNLGAYETDTLAEDMEVSIKLLKEGHKVVFEPDSYSITEAPEKFEQLYKQRKRWSYGGFQVLFKHSSMIFNPRYGLLSMFALPYLLMILITSIFGPLFIINSCLYLLKAGLSQLGFLSLSNFDTQVFLYSLAIFGLTTISEVISYLYAAYFDRGKNKYILAIFIPFLILFYNMMIGVISIVTITRALKGKFHGWGHLQRTGNVQQVSSTPLSNQN